MSEASTEPPSFDSLEKGSPAVERATAGKDLIGSIGLVALKNGMPDFVSDPTPEFLRDQRDSWGADWEPLPGPFSSQNWHLSDGTLSVPGCEIATGTDFRCSIGLGLGSNLVGVISSGIGLVGFDQDGAPKLGSLNDRGWVYLIVWPVADIEFVEYSRLRRYMKMWEAELSIVGSGAQLSGTHFRHQGSSRPHRHKSAARDFADDIGQIRSESGLSAGIWSEDIISRSEESHRLTFAS